MLNRTEFNKYNFFVFLIWPLIAILVAFKKKEHNFIKVFLPLFTGILGYTYVPKPGSDVNRTIEKFNYLNSLRFSL